MNRVKALVFSDSHGSVSPMIAAVERHRPDMLIHLGDCWQDGQRLSLVFPGLPLEQVNGNCDRQPQGIWEKCIAIGARTALICHGHTLGVKSGYEEAIARARRLGVDFLLFGHTHRAEVQRLGPLWLMNPGSVGDPTRGSYGIIELEEKGGPLCRVLPAQGEEDASC